MKPFLSILLCSTALAQPDPFYSYSPTQFVPYNDQPGSGYARVDYQWYLHNTGQNSDLYLNGVYQSSEAGGMVDISILGAWSRQPNAIGVTVAVIDSGVTPDGVDLSGEVDGGIFFDTRHGTTSEDYSDYNNGHGTLIANIIGGHRGNGVAISGIADGLRMLIVSQQYDTAGITAGIWWALTNGADIACLSWGETTVPDLGLMEAINAANGHMIIVSGVANNGVDLDASPTYPYGWNLPNVVEVCGITRMGQLYGPSSHGVRCIAAPARVIVSVGTSNVVQYSSGNSFASPQVAGVLALMKAKAPEQTPEQLVALLKLSTRKDIPGIQGRLDAYQAIVKANGTLK